MYDFKRWPELVRSILLSIFAYVGPILVATDLKDLDDENWERWIAALGLGIGHAIWVGFKANFDWDQIKARFTIR